MSTQASSMSQEEDMDKNSKIGLLIELIQSFEFLYNLKHKDYKNIKRKDQAWREIGAILKMSVEECQRHWKTLRDRYTKERRDFGQSGSEAPESSWFFFDKMSFYGKYTKPRKTFTTTPTTSRCSSSASGSRPGSAASFSTGRSAWSTIMSPEPEIQNVEFQEDFPEDDLETEVDLEINQGDDDEEMVPTPKEQSCPPRTPQAEKNQEIPSGVPINSGSAKRVKRKTAKARQEDEDEVLDVAKNLASSIANREVQKNKNRTFVEYLYSILEDMPADEAKETRKQILQLIIDK